MTVSADSRYVHGQTVVITLPDGRTSRMLWQATLLVQGVEYQYWTVSQGDRLDMIALRIFGDPTKWWMIADMNPELIWPADLTPGTLLRIPLANFDETTNKLSPFTFSTNA